MLVGLYVGCAVIVMYPYGPATLWMSVVRSVLSVVTCLVSQRVEWTWLEGGMENDQIWDKVQWSGLLLGFHVRGHSRGC